MYGCNVRSTKKMYKKTGILVDYFRKYKIFQASIEHLAGPSELSNQADSILIIKKNYLEIEKCRKNVFDK